jgi:hypothetical protein
MCCVFFLRRSVRGRRRAAAVPPLPVSVSRAVRRLSAPRARFVVRGPFGLGRWPVGSLPARLVLAWGRLRPASGPVPRGLPRRRWRFLRRSVWAWSPFLVPLAGFAALVAVAACWLGWLGCAAFVAGALFLALAVSR